MSLRTVPLSHASYDNPHCLLKPKMLNAVQPGNLQFLTKTGIVAIVS